MNLERVALFALIPMAAAFVGGLIAALRNPGATVRSAVQHFAAGIVFAAAALELLPKVRTIPVAATTGGFALGIVLMFCLRLLTDRLEQKQERSAVGLQMAGAADTFTDGIILGAAFTQGARQGLMIAIALTLEVAFLGLSVATVLDERTPKWRVVATSTGLGLGLVVGAIAGAQVFHGASRIVLGGVFAFGAVVFMYLVTEELLTQAHAAKELPWLPAVFFVGFFIYLIIERFV